MNRTIEDTSNVEIKIPYNPMTGGVNKSVFYGTQPLHSHRGIILKHVDQRLELLSLPLSLVWPDTFVGEIKLGINTELFC